jgi:hypothetical protein
MGEDYKQVGPTLDQMRALAGATDAKAVGSISSDADPGQAARTATALKTPKQWATKTPKSYESNERKAIQGESKSKGSTGFRSQRANPGAEKAKERSGIQNEGQGSTGFKFGHNQDAYPKTLTPEQRKTAAGNIKKELKGKTGQERAEKRAELMDPGPGDE